MENMDEHGHVQHPPPPPPAPKDTSDDESYKLLAKHVVITEVTTTSEEEESSSGEEANKDGEKKEENPSDEAMSTDEKSESKSEASQSEKEPEKDSEKKRTKKDGEDKFYVEEPFDFIFEPDHYPKSDSENAEKRPKLSDDQTDVNEDEHTKQHKYAQVIRELDDGVIEYEYKSYTYDRSFYTNKLNEDLDSVYFEEFNSFHHLRSSDSQIRGASLSRWPQVGFGFELGVARVAGDRLVYVSRISADSPAELSSLKLGDILIEIDDETPSERFSESDSDSEALAKINDYVSKRENLHLMLVHESQYARLKSENEDLLKNYYFNCEDFVVVNLHKQQQISDTHKAEHLIH